MAGRQYNEAEISDGLAAVAFCNGSPSRAARELKSQGRAIPRRTLAEWKVNYPDRYEAAKRQVRDYVWGRVGEQWREVAEKSAEATADAVEASKKAVSEGNSKEANTWASTARNLATSGGISHDKSSLVDGRPTERREEHRSMPELLRQIERLLPGTVDANRLQEVVAEDVEVKASPVDEDA